MACRGPVRRANARASHRATSGYTGSPTKSKIFSWPLFSAMNRTASPPSSSRSGGFQPVAG
jgi:hypothetical protein